MSCGDQECSLFNLQMPGFDQSKRGQPDEEKQMSNVSYIDRTSFAVPEPMTFYSRKPTYDGIVKYYGDLLLTKVDSPNPSYDMYACQLSCLCSEKRFIFAITYPDGNPIGYKKLLSRIAWVSFQTRVSTTEYDVLTHAYEPYTSDFINTPIRQIRETERGIIYQVEGHPMNLELLGNRFYRDSGTVGDALEMFASVLYFI